MPSEQKTISIDPDFFVRTEKSKSSSSSGSKMRGNRETLRREKKAKPKMPKGPSSNTLRKNLLARIKDHQLREQKEFQKKSETSLISKPQSKSSNEFDDEFSKSLAYLSELAKATEMRRHEKKHKHKNTLTLKTSSMRNQRPPTAYHRNDSIRNPEVSLNLPSDLAEPMYEVNVLPTRTPETNLTSSQTINIPKESIPEKQTAVSTISVVNKDVPYGILRGGNKPTYREYTRKHFSNYKNVSNDNSHIATDNNSNNTIRPGTTSGQPIMIHDYVKPQVVSVREQMLNEMKMKRQEASQSKLVIPKLPKQKRMKTIKRTTSKRKFKLGKDGKKRVISVLIKNNATRRQVKLELGRLKTVPLKDVRHYLKRHGLLKVGSVAPPDVLRMIYEQSVLSGDIHNTAKETLIHNFLNDKEPSW